MKNKIIAAALSAVLALGAMAGCEQKKDDTVVRVGSLKGPQHGGASNKAYAMMKDLREHVNDWTDEKAISSYLADIINKKGHHPAVCTAPDECVGCASCALMCPDCVITVEK